MLDRMLAGAGIVTDADGQDTVIGPGGLVACPAGPSGRHAFRSLGEMPLQLLCVWPTAGGTAPATIETVELEARP